MQTLNTFLLVIAIIWFLLLTCLGNWTVIEQARAGKRVSVTPWTLVVDLLVVAYLITRLIQYLS